MARYAEYNGIKYTLLKRAIGLNFYKIDQACFLKPVRSVTAPNLSRDLIRNNATWTMPAMNSQSGMQFYRNGYKLTWILGRENLLQRLAEKMLQSLSQNCCEIRPGNCCNVWPKKLQSLAEKICWKFPWKMVTNFGRKIVKKQSNWNQMSAMNSQSSINYLQFTKFEPVCRLGPRGCFGLVFTVNDLNRRISIN